MAGLGFKVFPAGSVLASVDVNGYLMSQAVGVYDDVADRLAKIVTFTEGMVSYLKDTDSLEFYTGSSWVAVGGGASGFENNFLLMGA